MNQPKRRKKSPKACPRCGSVAVQEKIDGSWECLRKGCEHTAKSFPTLHALSRKGHDMMLPQGSPKGMAPGCTMIRPGGNKYS